MTDILLSSLQTLTQDPATLTTLTAKGFNTIFDIANEPLQTFCQTLVGVPEAEAIYDAANARVAALSSINRTLRARNEPVMQGIPKLGIASRPAELEAAIGRSLGGVVDFDDLFDERSSAYAEVTSIQSLFSPGRYLVELYKLAKELHTENSPLHIEKRRPDIKDLVLNENNLNQETSTLSILNEILLKGIQAAPGAPDLRMMETTFFPMTLPYHDNLVQIRSVLAKNKLSLQQLWAALADDQLTAFCPIEPDASIGSLNPDYTPSPTTREQLQLTPELYTLLGTTAADEATTKRHYGLASDADITTQLKSVDAFIARTGLTFNQLIEMTAQADYSRGMDATVTDLIDDLAPGESRTVTFSFDEDPGSAFSAADVFLSNATLGPISGTGTTRTATVTSNAPNLLTNGSFTGGATGWDIAGTVMLHGNGHMTFESGTSVNGVIQQTVSTVQGQTYVVQFWLAGHNDRYRPCTATAQALSGTTVLGSLATTANLKGATVKFSFVAASTTTTIKLTETFDDESNEYYFDDFVVACVPRVAIDYNFNLMQSRFWHYGDNAPTNVNVYGQTYLAGGNSNPAALLVHQTNANLLELELSSANAVNYCDRTQRLTRLQRKVNIPFHELDWLIKNANEAVCANRPLQLDTPVLGVIAEFTRLSSKYGLSSDEFTCFIGDMNTFARQSQQSLFQRLFTSNLDGTTLALNATLNFDSSVYSADTAIVCGALKVSADELQHMAQLAFDLDNPNAVIMSSMRYAQLYRLAMIPRMLGLSFTQAKVLWDLINPGQSSAKRIGQTNTLDILKIIRQTETVLTWMGDNQLDLQTVLNMTTNSYSPVLTPDLYNFTHNLFTSLTHDTDVSGQPAAGQPLSSALQQRLYQAIAPVFGCKPNVMAKLLQWLDAFFRLPDDKTAYGLGDFWSDVQKVHGAPSGADVSQASVNVARYSQGMAQYALIAQWANLTEQDLRLIVDDYAWFMVLMSRAVFTSRVNTFVMGDQGQFGYGESRSEQGMTSLADGDWVVTWNSNGQDDSGLGVYQQRFDAKGMAVGGETRVNTTTTNNQCDSRVTGLTNGGWVVTWMDAQNALDVFQQCFDANGNKVGVETRVNTATIAEESRPDVAALPGGAWIVVFQDASSGSYFIKMQRYSANGTAVGGNITVNTSSGGHYEPTVATLHDGGWVVGWHGEDALGDIYMQAYNADGSKRGLETRCNTYSPGTQKNVDISGLSDGGWLVTWQSPGQDGSGFGIYQQRYNANGLTQGPENRVNTVTAGDQKLAAVCALTGGGWVVTWQSNNQFSATSGNDIYQQHFDANGIKVGREELVNAHFTVGEQTAPNITASADGGWIISWVSAGQDGSGLGIYQRHYLPSDGVRPSLPLLLRVARLKQWQLRTVVPAATAIGYFDKANQSGLTSTEALDTLATIHGWDGRQTALMNDALVSQQIYPDFPRSFDDVCHLETWMQACAHLTVGSNCLVQLNEMSKPQASAQASDLIRGVAEQLTATLTH